MRALTPPPTEDCRLRFNSSGDGEQYYDCSDSTMVEGLAGLIARLRVVYPYTSWRRLDWDALSAKYTPAVSQAQSSDDFNGYLKAVMELGADMYDGHISVEWGGQTRDGTSCTELTTQASLIAANVGGGYGAGFVRDDEGDVRVVGISSANTGLETYVRPNPAKQHPATNRRAISLSCPIQNQPPSPNPNRYDRVTEVNGVAIDTYLTESVSLAWAGSEASYPAVDANIDAERLAYLSRGPIGSSMTLTIERGYTAGSGGGEIRQVALTATAAALTESTNFGKGYEPSSLPASCVTSRVLAASETYPGSGSGVMGYLQVGSFSQVPSYTPTTVVLPSYPPTLIYPPYPPILSPTAKLGRSHRCEASSRASACVLRYAQRSRPSRRRVPWRSSWTCEATGAATMRPSPSCSSTSPPRRLSTRWSLFPARQ